MRGSIPLSSAKLNKMSKELKRILLKEKMMEVKAGDYLEWYDSLDAVEKGLYKEEFKKLQENMKNQRSNKLILMTLKKSTINSLKILLKVEL